MYIQINKLSTGSISKLPQNNMLPFFWTTNESGRHSQSAIDFTGIGTHSINAYLRYFPEMFELSFAETRLVETCFKGPRRTMLKGFRLVIQKTELKPDMWNQTILNNSL